MSKITWDSLFNFSNSTELKNAIALLNQFDTVYEDLVKTATAGSKQMQANQRQLAQSLNSLKKEINGLSEANKADQDAIQQSNAQAKALNETYQAQKKEIAQLNAQIEKLTKERQQTAKAVKDINNINKEAIKLEAQLGKLTGQQAKETASLKLQIQEKRKALKQEAQEAAGRVSLYQKESARLVDLRNKYRDLALAEKANTKEAKLLEQQITALNGKLTKVDAKVGVFGRNVGNYASSWNGLNNSINQLTREAPAFAVSLNTGFLALSNNIPILADEITKLNDENKKLIDQGKPTKNVFKSIAGAVFSFQTLMSVGVTLLVLYGDKLGDLAKKAFDVKDSFDAFKESQKESLAQAGQSISKFRALTSVVIDNTKSEEDRKAAIDELNKSYPDFNTNIFEEAKSTRELSKEVKEYNKLLEKRALAQAALSLSEEKAQKVIEDQLALSKAQEALEKVREGTRLNRNKQLIGEAKALKDVKDAQEALSKSTEELTGLTNIVVENFDKNTFENTANGAKKANKEFKIFIDEAKRFSDTAQREFIGGVSDLIFGKPEDVQKAADRNVAIVSKALQERSRIAKQQSDLRIEIERQEQQVRRDLIRATADVISMTGNQLFTNAQINRENDLKAFQDAKAIELEAAGENAQKRAAIEQQIRERERQANIREAKAQRAQRLFNIGVGLAETLAAIKFNAAILASNPATAPLVPFALAQIPIAVGVAGVQAGLVLSQPLPAFEKGGVMEKTGLAQVSEAGREMIIDPKGNITMTGNKGAELREIEGGSTILNNAITESILKKGLLNNNDVNNGASANIQDLLRAERDRTARIMASTMKSENDLLMDTFEKAFKTMPEIHQFKFKRGELDKSVRKGNTRYNGWESVNSYS